MKSLNIKRFYQLSIVFVVALFTTVGILNTQVSADCYQYTTTKTVVTSATPVFNNFCNVPYSIGNEANFVRIRQDINGNVMDNINNPAYSNGLTSNCATGTKFDIWNYLHNDASPNYNPDLNPSNPSAVAHNVKENLSASFGQNTQFSFSDTITASNATTVTDSTTLNCGNNKVQLSLVPGSVHIYSLQYSWNSLPDGTINNGPVQVGSPALGSGDMWGCWNYRIVIVYQVEVTAIPTVTVNPVCNLISLEANGMVAKLDDVSYSSGSATVTGVTVNFGDGAANSIIKLTPAQVAALSATNPYVYTYTKPGNYTVQATVNSSLGDVTSSTCTTVLSPTTPPSTPPTTPPSTPPTTPPTKTPTTLVNTGPGSTIALFFGSTLVGTLGYGWFTKRSKASL